MKKRIKSKSIYLCSCILLILTMVGCVKNQPMQVKSPDGKLSVNIALKEGLATYSIRRGTETILNDSPLGLVRSDADYTQSMTLAEVSKSQSVSETYNMLHGKRSKCEYKANRRVFTLENPQKKTIQVVFQVSNDGVAFCYRFPKEGNGQVCSVTQEATGFAFPAGTSSWLHQLHDSKTGWSKTYPSYEAHYAIDQPVGKPSPQAAGWAFPALFKTGENWVLISETDVDGSYCGCRLGQDSTGGLYRIAFPQEQEHRGPQDPVAPQISLPFESPWRIIIIGDDLKTIVESTLATDLASPPNIDSAFIKPGRAAWSWLRYDSSWTTLEGQHKFLDMAVKMNWEYMLVDADWDRQIGEEKIADLSKEAQEKGVKLIIWYNSNGQWNDAPLTPKNRMHTAEVRQKELKWLKEIGVSGIKVDFFGGDKQATMQLYMDIMKDTAEYGLLCNFHGATLPRGWQRTWPNMVTTEAVMGMEYCTFDQINTDQQAQHCCVLAFTRNVVAPMDFTPVIMDRKVRGVTRVTSPAFELALPVVFESGIQHFGLAPFEADKLPKFAIDYLRKVPTTWDETRLVAGHPAKDVVFARRKGDTWYVAGINGEKNNKTMKLDLSFLPKDASGLLITDGQAADQLIQNELQSVSSNTFQVDLQPQGGFVLQIK